MNEAPTSLDLINTAIFARNQNKMYIAHSDQDHILDPEQTITYDYNEPELQSINSNSWQMDFYLKKKPNMLVIINPITDEEFFLKMECIQLYQETLLYQMLQHKYLLT